MSEARKCDRCGAFYSLDSCEDRPAYAGCKLERVLLQTDSGKKSIIHFDLCADCANKTFNFLTGSEGEAYWIEEADDAYTTIYCYRCSNCGNCNEDDTDYCPDCGCRMTDVKGEEE